MRDRHFFHVRWKRGGKVFTRSGDFSLQIEWQQRMMWKKTRTWGGRFITSGEKSVNLTDLTVRRSKHLLSWHFVGTIYWKKNIHKKTTVWTKKSTLELQNYQRVKSLYEPTDVNLIHTHTHRTSSSSPHRWLHWIPIILGGITHPQNCQRLSNHCFCEVQQNDIQFQNIKRSSSPRKNMQVKV